MIITKYVQIEKKQKLIINYHNYHFLGNLKNKKEKLCNTAKGRELPECWQSSTTLPPSIVPLTTSISDVDYVSEVTSIRSQLGNDILYLQM